MKARVLKGFHDKKEKIFRKKGEEFEVNKDRFTDINATRYGVLVEAVEPEENEYPEHTGGGYYELSNGDKVKGKAKAFQAENELK